MLPQMNRILDRFYSTFITRIVRHPRSNSQPRYLPRLLLIPDMPVAKYKKKPIAQVSINGGLHIHGVLLMPPVSRLKVDLVSHLNQHQPLYLRHGLLGIQVQQVHSNLPRVVDYVFKSLKRHTFTFDDILIYPKSATE